MNSKTTIATDVMVSAINKHVLQLTLTNANDREKTQSENNFEVKHLVKI